MAKTTGLGDAFFVDGVDLSGDVGSLSRIAGGNTPLEVTGINKFGFERIGGVRDGGIEWSSWFNPTGAHAELSTLPRGDRVVSYFRGTTRGSQAAAITAKQVNYDPTRNADGSLTIAVQALANKSGLEWGRQLTAGVESRSAAGALAGVGHAGSTSFGLQAYLHVFAFTGTSATVAIQHSNDDGAVDPYADVSGAVFTAATAAGAERVETARNLTVKRWLRVNVTGTFTALDLAVLAVKNDVSVVF